MGAVKPVGQLYGSPTALTAKPNTSRQKRQNQSYFAFAVKYLVCFCRDVFAVMFLFLP